MRAQWVIERKRDGAELTPEEIEWFLNGYTCGDIPDYQMAALAMAIFLRGMTFAEIAVLTEVMMNSGSVVDASRIEAPKVDKHSTGGIGDKVSLVLAPLAAELGMAVPMISGRGLGISGGTLDKLESIPGFRTDLSEAELLRVVEQCGCCITGQTAELAPADRMLYALRDVTGTVPSIPLITASIMCKKLAEGIDSLVLDVKVGRGAFMSTIEQARDLGRTMVQVGTKMGKRVSAVITGMDQPLGRCVGHSLEVMEAVEVLRGGGPADLIEVTLALTEQMVELAGGGASGRAAEVLRSGAAFERFKDMVRLQGGDPAALEDPYRLPASDNCAELAAPVAGYVVEVNAHKIGAACVLLGGGRSKVGDSIDFGVGFSRLVKTGEEVALGAPLLRIHSASAAAVDRIRPLLDEAVVIGPEPLPAADLIREVL